MPNSHPAYRAGEFVRFASYDQLLRLQEDLGRKGPQGEKLIHDLLLEDWTVPAGKRARIKTTSEYHMGTILYELHEVEGHWLEGALVDLSLTDGSDHEIDELAMKHYEIRSEVTEGDSGLVQIVGRVDDDIYCSLRKNYAELERANIEIVTGLRTKANFERLYGFDGLYKPPTQ